ncbi:hypothetical protein [Vitiosangium sp. GDMCC 1.1324]|uniref:hypothetical protein n=1 Tax=Vitiosangium sp. (strain GDMCC 1.1324) TaxID=2138576 RepID=UPI000D3635AE|nr:hypothetical protein [Vitiosangium sp. GDMCC 1.1324]PTL83127.1 hypothetical protein DAT35_14035 [Vitiosangium sp. GDMCC 1.1324]
MRLPSTIALSACLLVSACGGSEVEEDSTPALPRELIGTYNVTGNLTTIVHGVSSSSPTGETLVLQAGTSREALTLELVGLGCDFQGQMVGARTFTLRNRSCALPSDDACTSTLNFSSGSGGVKQEGLEVSLEAQRLTRCGGVTTATSITLVLSGPRK